MSITLNQSIHGKCSYIQYFLKLSYNTSQGFEQPVSNCAHIYIFSLDGLNKDEAISKLIFEISICGAA